MHDIQGIFCNYSISYDYNLIIHTHMHAHYLYSLKCRTVFEVQNSLTQHDSTFCHAQAMLPAQGSEGVRQAQKSKTDLSLHIRPCCNGWSFCVAMLQWLGYVGICWDGNHAEMPGLCHWVTTLWSLLAVVPRGC